MIVKILFLDTAENQEFAVMFGNSYKKWETQFEEYWRILENRKRKNPDLLPIKILRAWKSNAKWIGWGGLKWCNETIFQKELNREGCQDNEPNNPKPRQYADMEFVNMPISKIEKLL